MYYIGIDLGGTNIVAGIVDESGSIVYKDSVKTDCFGRDQAAILDDMGNLVNKVIADYGIDKKDVKGVGVGSPGIPNSAEGKIVYSNNIKFFDVDLRTPISEITGLDVFVDNDANCAALGENAFGAAKGAHSSITITLGTGVGAGYIIDGKIISGFNYAAPEMGHMTICMDGEQCTCGKKGCWEAYASATALIRDTKRAIEAHPESRLLDYAKVPGDIDTVNARTAFDACRAGDEQGAVLVDNYIKYVAEGLANLINSLQPEVIAIGGGISNEGDYLLKPLREKVLDRTYGRDVSESVLPRTKIVKAQLGNDAGIVGAAMLSAQK